MKTPLLLLIAMCSVASNAWASEATRYVIEGPYSEREAKSAIKRLSSDPVDQADNRRFLSVAHDVKLQARCKAEGWFKAGPSGLLKPKQELTDLASLRIASGLYEARLKLTDKSTGQSYYLLPAKERDGDIAPQSNAATQTRNHRLYVGVDPGSGKVLGREILVYDRRYQLLTGDWGPWQTDMWAGGCNFDPKLTTGTLLVSSLSEREFDIARQSAMVTNARQRNDAMAAEADRTRPQKSQIGTSICKTQSDVLLEGFTEARSPDSNKIQIRIWRASFPENGRPSRVSPPGFKEQIIWDDPDNWTLCQ